MGLLDKLFGKNKDKEETTQKSDREIMAESARGKTLYYQTLSGQKDYSKLTDDQKRLLANYEINTGRKTTSNFTNDEVTRYGLTRSEERTAMNDSAYGQTLYYSVTAGRKNKNSLTDNEKKHMYNYMLKTGRATLSEFSDDAIKKYELGGYKREETQTAEDSDKNALDGLVDTLSKGVNVDGLANNIKNFGANWSANFRVGEMNQDLSLAYYDYLKHPTEQNLAKVKEIEAELAQFTKDNPNVGQGGWVSNEFANYLPQLFDQIGYSAKYGLGGAVAGAAGGSLAGGVGAIPGAIFGGKAGAVAGSTQYGYETMAGAAYKTLVEMGVPHDIARQVSLNTGFVNSLIEGAETAVDIASFGATTVGKALGKEAVEEAVEGATKKTLKDKLASKAMEYGWKPVLATAGKAYAKNLVTESLEESTQEASSILFENYAIDKANAQGANIQTPKTTHDEAWDRMGEAGLGGFKIAAIGGLASSGAQVGKNLALNKYQKQTVTNAIDNIEKVTNDEATLRRGIEDGSLDKALDVVEKKLTQIEEQFPEDQLFLSGYRQHLSGLREEIARTKSEMRVKVEPDVTETNDTEAPTMGKPVEAKEAEDTTPTTTTNDVVEAKPKIDADGVVETTDTDEEQVVATAEEAEAGTEVKVETEEETVENATVDTEDDTTVVTTEDETVAEKQPVAVKSPRVRTADVSDVTTDTATTTETSTQTTQETTTDTTPTTDATVEESSSKSVKTGKYKVGDVVTDESGTEYTVIEFERNGKTMYGLRDDKAGATHFFDTPADLQMEIDRIELVKASQGVSDTYNQTLSDINAEEQQTREDVHGFADGKSNLQKGNIKKALTKTITHNGKTMTRKQFIEMNLHKRVEAVQRNGKTEYRMYNDDNSFVNLTKTEYEYHQYLNNIGFEYDESVYNKDFKGMRDQAHQDYLNGLNNVAKEYEAQRDAEEASGGEQEVNDTAKETSDEAETALSTDTENDTINTTEVETTNDEKKHEAKEDEDVQEDDRRISQGTATEGVSSDESNEQADGVHQEEERGDGEAVQSDVEGTDGSTGRAEQESGDISSETGRLRNDPVGNNRDNQGDVSGGNQGFVITSETDLGKQTPVARYDNNVKAIETMNAILQENRQATAEEMAILAKFSGWGGLKDAFIDKTSEAWKKRGEQLKKLLTPEQYKKARSSTLDAFYTPVSVVQSVYDILNQLGVNGNAKFLEPSCGTGNFLGCMPVSFRDNAKIVGVELDEITGNIAKLLYPNADIKVQGFEKTNVRPNSVDVVIGNIPFGDFKVGYDKNYPAYSKYNIHDYFVLKTLDNLREGGVMAVITTKGTLDKESSDVRKLMAEKANLVGAVRFPAGTFTATDVVADLLVLQKKGENVLEEPGNSFLNLSEYNGVQVNEYFATHPEMILGELGTTRGQFGMEMTVKDTGRTIADVVDMFPRNLFTQATENATNQIIEQAVTATTETTEIDYSTYPTGTIYEKDGVLMMLNDEGNPERYHTVTKSGKNKGVKKYYDDKSTVVKRARGMLGVLDAYEKVIDIQKRTDDDAALAEAQKVLNDRYDKFVKQFGFINSRANSGAFAQDSRYFRIASAEDKAYSGDEVVYTKGDVFNKRTIFPKSTPNKVSNAKDALSLSLNMCNGINLAYMEEKYGKSAPEIIGELGDLVYELPETSNAYVTADEYLSGNVKEKLRVAEERAKTDPRYERNVEALKKVQPAPLTSDAISVDIGSPWLGEKYFGDFVREIYGIEPDDRRVKVLYEPYRSHWSIHLKGLDFETTMATRKWGTERIKPAEIIEALANNKEIVITDKDNGQTYTNVEETALAVAKADEIREYFNDWVFKDADRRRYLEDYYNEHYNNLVTRQFDGSHLQMPGSSITLRPHQASGVARILSTKNTLLAHAVGSGKTYTMIGAAYEMKRLGVAHKPLMVVPNHKVGDFLGDFYKMYPGANVLALSEQDFTPANKKKMLAKIQSSDFDCVIMRHSSFEKFGFSPEYEQEYVQRQLDELEEAIMAAVADGMSKGDIKALEKRLNSLKAKLEKLLSQPRENIVYFDEAGIDAILVDEAHNFKNLSFPTKMTRVAGVNSNGSAAATHMHMATEHLNRNNGKVIFATGTPVSNTMGELYSLLRYCNPEALAEYNIQSFDAWASTFGEIVTNTEMNTTGSNVITKRRFSKFKNVPELIKIFKMTADIVGKADLPNIKLPNANKYHITANSSDTLRFYNSHLDYKKTHMSYEEAKKGGHLVLMQDARMAALDLRCVKGLLIDEGIIPSGTTDGELDLPGSKINLAVDNIYKEYVESDDRNGTQVVFLDRGVPGGLSKQKQDKLNAILQKDSEDITEAEQEFIDECASTKRYPFDLYNDIKNKLIAKGVDPKHIAFIQDNNTVAKKQELFDKMNAGEVRILLGSTSMMGEGMNVQKKAVALHQLDAPMRPSDVEQRVARVLRQGNENSSVNLYNYSTLNSYDAPTWGMLDRKQKTINQVMKGDESIREIEDLGEDDFATMSVEAANNPLMFERKDVSDSLNKLKSKKRNFIRERNNMQDVITNHPKKAARITERLETAKATHKVYTKNTETPTVIGKQSYDKLRDASLAILEYATKNRDKSFAAGTTATIGTFKGFKLTIKRTSYNKYAAYLEGTNIAPVEADMFLNEETNPNGDKPSTVLLRLNNQLKNLESVITSQEKALQAENKSFEDAKANVNGSFKQEAELNRLAQRLREIDNELNAIANGKQEARPATDIDETSDTDNFTTSNLESPEHTGVAITKGTGKNNKRTDKTLTAQELVQEFEKAYGIHISKGGIVGSKRIAGQYRMDKGVMTRYAHDLPVISHEVGHDLDTKHKLSSVTTIRAYVKGDMTKATEVRNQLEQIGRDSLPADKRDEASAELCRREGVAETVRRLFSNRDDLADYTAVVDYIRATVGEKNDKLFDYFYDLVTEIADLSVEERVANDISMNEEQTTYEHGHEQATLRGDNVISRSIDKVLTQVFDRTRPLDALMDMVAETLEVDRNTISYDQDFYTKARLASGGSKGIVLESLFNQQRDLKGEVVGDGLQSILREVLGEDKKDFETNYKDFNAYLVAMRSLDYQRKGQVMPQSYATYHQAINELRQKHPEFESIREKLATFMDNELQMMKDAGLLNQEQYDIIKKNNAYYAPMNRIVEGHFGTKNNRKGTGSLIKRTKGGGETIIDPLESIVTNAFMFRQASMRNDTVRTMAEMVEQANKKSPVFASVLVKMPARKRAETVNLLEFYQELVEQGVLDKNSPMYAEQLKALDVCKTLFRPDLTTKNADEIVIYSNGKPTVYKINDRGLFDYFSQSSKLATNAFLQIGATVSNILRTGTITTFKFPINNFMRDVPTAIVQSEAGITPIDIVKAIKSVVKKDERYHEFMASGAATEFLVPDRRTSQRLLEQMFPQSLVGRMLDAVYHPIDTFRSLTEASEIATRLAEYTKLVEKKGVEKHKAALQARLVTGDFTNGGSNKALKGLIRVSAFTGSSLQGTYEFLKNWKRHPARTMSRALLVSAIPSVVARLMIADDDESEEAYQEMPEWRRIGFLNIPVGGGHFLSIPKPYGYGIVGIIAEKCFDGLLTNETNLTEETLSAVVSQFIPDIQINAIAPLWQVATNKNWNGAAILNYSDQNVKAYAQRDQNSSLVATTIADIFKDTPLLEDYVSPKKIDHLVKGYLGSYGDMWYRMPDKIVDFIRWGVGVAEAGGMTDEQIKQVASSVIQPWVQESYASYPQHRTDFNEIYYDLQELRRTNKSMDVENKAVDRMYQKLNDFDKKLEPLDKKRKAIISDSELSSKEKTQQLKEVHRQMAEISKKALAYYHANKSSLN